MVIGLTDTLMVGRVGVVPLAAAAFVNAIAHLPFVFGIGLLSSVNVLTSQAFGAQKSAEAGEVLRHGLVLATLTGLIVAIGLTCLRPFLHLFGQPAEAANAAGLYLVLFGWSLLPALIAQVCKQFSESLNRPWIPNFILLGGAVLNIVLNWVLVFGHWGAPALGLNGSGWATVIARTFMALCLLVYILRAAALQIFQPLNWWVSLSWERMQRLIQLGWPVATQHLLEVSAFAFAAVMMGWISADAIAAHQIALTCAATTFHFGLGVGMATCIRVGQAWGAQQPRRVRRIGYVGIALSGGTMALFGVLFVVAGEPIARLFVTSPAVVELARQMFLVAALFQVADGVQIAAICGLRGLSDVRVPAVLAALSYWIIAVPLGSVLAFGAGQGPIGVWIGLAVGLAIAAIGLSWRFRLKSRVVPQPVSSLFKARSNRVELA
jgi:multidrug resistance protein, MATE family